MKFLSYVILFFFPSLLLSQTIDALTIDAQGNIYVTALKNLFLSTNTGETWQSVAAPFDSKSVAVNNGALFIGAFQGTVSDGIYRSTDGGITWIHTLTEEYASCFAFGSEGKVFAGTDKGIFRSSDNGNNWVLTNNGLPANAFIYSLVINSNGYIFASLGYMGLYRSTNDGEVWTKSDTGMPGTIFQLRCKSDDKLFACTWYAGVYRSTNNGDSWVQIINGLNPGLFDFRCLVFNSSELIFTSSNEEFYRSSNNGDNWNLVCNTEEEFLRLESSPADYLFAGTWDGVYKSIDNGQSWINTSNGITGLLEELSEPKEFILYQNYPNPFNPKTVIKYSIPNRSFVNITIYDVLGNEVAILVNTLTEAGEHRTTFNGTGISGGVYLYRMSWQNSSAIKKFILLK